MNREHLLILFIKNGKRPKRREINCLKYQIVPDYRKDINDKRCMMPLHNVDNQLLVLLDVSGFLFLSSGKRYLCLFYRFIILAIAHVLVLLGFPQVHMK